MKINRYIGLVVAVCLVLSAVMLALGYESTRSSQAVKTEQAISLIHLTQADASVQTAVSPDWKVIKLPSALASRQERSAALEVTNDDLQVQPAIFHEPENTAKPPNLQTKALGYTGTDHARAREKV
jgi:hypothetical protein